MKAIHNITAVTMDSNRRILSDAILIFEDGIFTTVDKAAAVDVPVSYTHLTLPTLLLV